MADAGQDLVLADAAHHEEKAESKGDDACRDSDLDRADKSLEQETPGRPAREEGPVFRSELACDIEAPDDREDAQGDEDERYGRPDADAATGLGTGCLVEGVAHGDSRGTHLRILAFLSIALPTKPIARAVRA